MPEDIDSALSKLTTSQPNADKLVRESAISIPLSILGKMTKVLGVLITLITTALKPRIS
jgi:hypothetical protein